MKQERIKELLEEAANPNCPPFRFSEILREFNEGWPHGMDNPEIGVADVLRLLAVDLFIDAVEHRRENLPSLFPVFAMVFGDRDLKGDQRYASIDWLLA